MIEELMKQLKKEYIETLPEKRKKILELFESQKWTELETEFHKMKGSGKTYGLAEMSLFGEVLESICINAPNKIARAMPLALNLINETYRLQNIEQSFDIESSREYIELNQMLK